jgi:hypothetical protein
MSVRLLLLEHPHLHVHDARGGPSGPRGPSHRTVPKVRWLARDAAGSVILVVTSRFNDERGAVREKGADGSALIGYLRDWRQGLGKPGPHGSDCGADAQGAHGQRGAAPPGSAENSGHRQGGRAADREIRPTEPAASRRLVPPRGRRITVSVTRHRHSGTQADHDERRYAAGSHGTRLPTDPPGFRHTAAMGSRKPANELPIGCTDKVDRAG